jgi:hypothetical protein
MPATSGSRARPLTGPEQVAALLDSFEIEKTERVERQVATPDGPRIAIDHVVRDRRPSRPD